MTVAPEMKPLIEGLRDVIEGLGDSHVERVGPTSLDTFAALTGFVASGRRRPAIVLGSQVGVELGHPKTTSRAILATTMEAGLVVDGKVTRIGPDLDSLVDRSMVPLGQVLLLELRQRSEPDPFELDNTMLLTNRLPGYMVRSVPGRLWVRIARDAVSGGLNLRAVGTALWFAYHEAYEEVTGVEVIFVTRSAADVEAIAPFELAAKAQSGEHKKLVLNENGELECSEESCESCDERDVCDAAREILRSRRAGRGV